MNQIIIYLLHSFGPFNQQIRIKGNIKKLNPKISDAHWNLRDPRKNALAVVKTITKNRTFLL